MCDRANQMRSRCTCRETNRERHRWPGNPPDITTNYQTMHQSPPKGPTVGPQAETPSPHAEPRDCPSLLLSIRKSILEQLPRAQWPTYTHPTTLIVKGKSKEKIQDLASGEEVSLTHPEATLRETKHQRPANNKAPRIRVCGAAFILSRRGQ